MPSYRLQELYHDLREGVPDMNADELTGTYLGKVRAVADGRVVASIDPEETNTPVADAKALLDATGTGGQIILPPGKTQEASAVSFVDTFAVDLIGHGYTGAPAQGIGSVLEFTDGTDKGFLLSDTDSCVFRDFSIRGPKAGNSIGVFHMDGTGSFNQTAKNNVVDRVSVHTWYGPFMDMTNGAPFQNSVGSQFVQLNDMDAGDATAILNWAVGGRANTFGNLAINPDSSVSAADSQIYSDTGGANNEAYFTWLNLGGTAGKIATVDGTAIFQAINWEPGSQNGTPADLIEFRNTPQFGAVWDMKLNSGTVDYVYNINAAGNKILVTPWNRNANATINNSRVNVSNSPPGGRHSVYYFGQSSEITNNSGESNGSIRTMDTAGGANA